MTNAGIFWLPESPERRVGGQLQFCVGELPRLELYDVLSERELESSENTENFVVHGFLRSGPHQVTLVTLLGCYTTFWRRPFLMSSDGFEDHFEILSARYVIRGAHTSGEDQLFTKVRLRVANIDSWADLSGLSLNTENAERVELMYQRIPLPSATAESGVTVRIDEVVTHSWSASTGGHLMRLCWILVENFGELAFSDISSDYITPMASILNFAIGNPSPITGIGLWTEGQWCVVWHGNMAEDSAKPLVQHEILLPLSTIGIHVLANFLDLYKKLGPLAPVIADIDSGLRCSALEKQVLVLTTVAEGLHSSLYPEDRRMTEEEDGRIQESIRTCLENASVPDRHRQIVQGRLKHLEEPSYKNRLKKLADVANQLLPEVSGDTDRWVKRVNCARNEFAHRAQRSPVRKNVDEYFAISQSLRWVLIAVFLVNSGVNVESCSTRIRHNSRYRQFLLNIQNSLPCVFSDSGRADRCPGAGGDDA